MLWPLNPAQADDAVAFIDSVAEAVHTVVA